MLLLRALLQVGAAVLLSTAGGLSMATSEQAVPCGCEAQALYTVSPIDTLFIIATRFQLNGFQSLQSLNNIPDPNVIKPGQLLRIPSFKCDCPSGKQPGAMPSHSFTYTVTQGDQDNTIPALYGNLTTVDAINTANAGSFDIQALEPGWSLQIPINCCCGNSSISDVYGLFGTYAAQPNDTLASLSNQFNNISQHLLQQYNPSVSFDPLLPFVSILFIPLTNGSGQYPPLITRASPAGGGASSQGTIIGAAVGGVIFVVLGLVVWFLWARYLKSSQKGQGRAYNQFTNAFDPEPAIQAKLNKDTFPETASNNHASLSADRCIHFSFSELAAATDNFSLSKEIGKGGFATVFYGEWHGQILAVKRMELKAQKEFSNELEILSKVHHANLLGLIGFCTERYLFLVYEFIDNGTLADHLRSGSNPMSWTTRVQIVLDAARGIEYLHDHTRPTYIHRDLKPSNILITSSFHGKVGDFGLTRLLDRDGDGLTNTISKYGTYGYMAPEYAQYGQISVKMDIFAFGVILFQIISGRNALIGTSEHLQSLFEKVLKKSNVEDELKQLVDPALGTDYHIEAVRKMADLAAKCTQRQPELRPQMREVVMQLMGLSDAHLLTQTT